MEEKSIPAFVDKWRLQIQSKKNSHSPQNADFSFLRRVEDKSLALTDLAGNFALSLSDFLKLSGWMRVQLKAIDSYLQAAHADSIKKAATTRFAKSCAVFCAYLRFQSVREAGDALCERKLPVFDARAGNLKQQKFCTRKKTDLTNSGFIRN